MPDVDSYYPGCLGKGRDHGRLSDFGSTLAPVPDKNTVKNQEKPPPWFRILCYYTLNKQEHEETLAMTMKDVRGAHNPKVVGSNPTPAISIKALKTTASMAFGFWPLFLNSREYPVLTPC
jgi:hypothetical protein